MIKIEPLSAVNPSTYNPRTADPKRLDLIELSLRKLGFIAPIYADANGEILSGHQRHFVATRREKRPRFQDSADGVGEAQGVEHSL